MVRADRFVDSSASIEPSWARDRAASRSRWPGRVGAGPMGGRYAHVMGRTSAFSRSARGRGSSPRPLERLRQCEATRWNLGVRYPTAATRVRAIGFSPGDRTFPGSLAHCARAPQAERRGAGVECAGSLQAPSSRMADVKAADRPMFHPPHGQPLPTHRRIHDLLRPLLGRVGHAAAAAALVTAAASDEPVSGGGEPCVDGRGGVQDERGPRISDCDPIQRRLLVERPNPPCTQPRGEHNTTPPLWALSSGKNGQEICPLLSSSSGSRPSLA